MTDAPVLTPDPKKKSGGKVNAGPERIDVLSRTGARRRPDLTSLGATVASGQVRENESSCCERQSCLTKILFERPLSADAKLADPRSASGL